MFKYLHDRDPRKRSFAVVSEMLVSNGAAFTHLSRAGIADEFIKDKQYILITCEDGKEGILQEGDDIVLSLFDPKTNTSEHYRSALFSSLSRRKLAALVEEHGLSFNHPREGAGKFLDVAIGEGVAYETLKPLCDVLVKLRGRHGAIIQRITNDQHPNYGKHYLELPSFWWE